VSPAETIGKITLRGDIDNYVKTVLDGLNGTAWEDDIQVVEVTAVKS
jgi:Holliday junction resolvase RusA-like endonuclease